MVYGKFLGKKIKRHYYHLRILDRLSQINFKYLIFVSLVEEITQAEVTSWESKAEQDSIPLKYDV
jgi:hypothetical protein